MRSSSRSAGGTLSFSISRRRPIAEALRRRAALAATDDLTAYRLIHGAADGVPGLAVDRFGDVAIVHADSAAIADEWLAPLRTELIGVCPTAYVKVHPRGVSRLSAEALRRFAPEAPTWGAPRGVVQVSEGLARYEVRPAGGLSVGLFLDMREVRRWLLAHSAGKTVLNLFAYTCSLGVSAALGGAERVVDLDVSRPYLEWGKANYALNDLAVDARNFIYGDAFDWLGRFARRAQTFDMVIVDPPSFSSTPFSVTRDYARLAEAAARVVARGGTLLAATNHAATTDERFDRWLIDGLAAAERAGHILASWHEPAEDFPVPKGGRPYLKVRALELN
jgi:23S rRNA (cytosine1962-C5)-methyltransferase